MLENDWIKSQYCSVKKSVVVDYNMPTNLGNNSALLFLYYRSDMDEYRSYITFPHQDIGYEVGIEQIKQYKMKNSNSNSKALLQEVIELMSINQEKKYLNTTLKSDKLNKVSKL